MPTLAGVNYLNTTHFNLVSVTIYSNLCAVCFTVCVFPVEKRGRWGEEVRGRTGPLQHPPISLIAVLHRLLESGV